MLFHNIYFLCYKGAELLSKKSCLPQMVPHFTGRQDECKEIIGYVVSGFTRMVTIWGSPGFGKTSVATAVGHDLQSQDWLVYWLSLRGLRSKADLESKLLSLVKQPFTSHEQPNQQLSPDDELCQHLGEIPGRFLVILDNTDDLLESGLPNVREEVIELLEEILRRNENITFLLATRESFEFMNLHFQGHQAVRIRPLDEASSQYLVHELLPNASTTDCTRIVQICGHVPLAIKLVCSSISEDDAQPSQFLDDCLEFSTNNIVKMLDNPDYPSHYRLQFLFDSSFQRLSIREKEALVSLSILPESINLQVAAAVLGETRISEARKIMQSLRRKSFLDYSSKSRSYLMHKLLQSFAREKGERQMKETVLISKERFHAFYVSLFEKLNEQFLKGHSMQAYIEFYENKEHFIESLIEGCSNSKTADNVFNVLVKAELFVDSLFWTLSEAGNFNKIYDSALKAARFLEKDVYYSRLLASRAFSEVTWGAIGISMRFLSKVSEIQATSSTVPSDERAKYLFYFGIFQLTCMETKSGVQCLQKSLCLMDKSSEHRVFRLIIFQILAVYYHSQNNPLSASKFYSKALQESRTVEDLQLMVIPAMESTTMEAVEQITSREKVHTLRDQPLQLQVIFHVKQATKQICHKDINKFLRKVILTTLKEVESALVNSKPGLFNFHRVVVSMLPFFRNFEDTINIAELRISNYQTGHSQFKIRSSHSDKETYDSCSEILKDARADAKKHMDHEEVQDIKENTLEILQSRQRAVELSINRFGENNSSTADSFHELGITEHALGHFTSALQSKYRALTIRRKLFGEEDPSAADSYHELGVTQYALGDLSSALHSIERALIIRQKRFGELHSKTANSYRELGVTQHKLGHLTAALESAQRALDIRRKLFGEEHLSTADSYHQQGEIQRSLDDLTQALQSEQHALQIRRNILGEEQSSTDDM